MGNDRLAMAALKKNLMDRYEMRDLGQAKLVIGMRVQRNRKERTILIDQQSYIEEALKRFNMVDANPTRTPLPSGANLEKVKDQKYKADLQLTRNYQALVSTLIYVIIGTRPDIAYAAICLS